MKKFLPLIALLVFNNVIAQPNSVSLKNGSGTLLAQYNSIAAAYSAISTPLTDAYFIEMTTSYTAANETFPLVFSVKAGASATNRITIRPEIGATISITTSTSGGNVFTLDDADYITIDGRPGGVGNTRNLTITNTATSANSNTIQLINGACNNIITYCNVNNSSTSTAGRGIALGVSTSNITGNSDNLVSYCLINGGRYAVNSVGTAANPNTRNKFFACSVTNGVFAGIWIQAGSSKVTIDSCQIYHTAAVNDGTYGILFDSESDTAIITKCNIYNLNSGTNTTIAKGIVIRSSLATNFVDINNCFINLPLSDNCIAVSGIEISASSATITTHARIVYNTIRIAGNLTSGGTSGNVVSAAIHRLGANASHNLEVRNNILVNERTGGNTGVQHLALAFVTTGGTYNLSNNTLNSSAGTYARYGSTVYNDIVSYQTGIPSGDPNANNFAISFVSSTDLHLSPSLPASSDLIAMPITNINNDIDLQERSASLPYRGADERLNMPLPLSKINVAVNYSNNQVLVKWFSNYSNVSKYEIERSLNGTTFNIIGSNIATNNTNYSFTDQSNFTNTKTVYYRVKLITKEGQIIYSNIVLLKLLEKDTYINVYPNPFTNYLQINITVENSSIIEYKLVNSLGVTVISERKTISAGNNSFNFSIPNYLQPGNYNFVLIKGNNMNSFKLLKQ